ncbi:hypothetical protein [Paenibacillus terreus]|uniref:hypothetical protein n=1 Tax=Paenibacillus terreus TaxID=1387834 RepID=UPI0035CD355E
MINQSVERVDGGFRVIHEDGTAVFVSDNELLPDNGLDSSKPKFSLRDLKSKVVSWKKDSIVPKPIRAMLFLKSDEDRRNYIKSMPQYSVNAMVTWFTYIILKGQILEKCVELGITIPADVASFIKNVETEVKKTGSMTIQKVSQAVEGVVDFTVAVAMISFGVLLILNPALLPIVLAVGVAVDVALLFSNSKSK